MSIIKFGAFVSVLAFAQLCACENANSDITELFCNDNATCIKELTEKLVSGVKENKTVKVFDLVTIEPIAPVVHEEGRSTGGLMARFFNNHAVKVDFGRYGVKVMRSARKDASMAVEIDEHAGRNFNGEGRGRSKKIMQVVLPLMLGVKAASTLIVAVAAVALLTFKAFLASKLALLVTVSMVIKKFMESFGGSSGGSGGMPHHSPYLYNQYPVDFSGAGAHPAYAMATGTAYGAPEAFSIGAPSAHPHEMLQQEPSHELAAQYSQPLGVVDVQSQNITNKAFAPSLTPQAGKRWDGMYPQYDTSALEDRMYERIKHTNDRNRFIENGYKRWKDDQTQSNLKRFQQQKKGGFIRSDNTNLRPFVSNFNMNNNYNRFNNRFSNSVINDGVDKFNNKLKYDTMSISNDALLVGKNNEAFKNVVENENKMMVVSGNRNVLDGTYPKFDTTARESKYSTKNTIKFSNKDAAYVPKFGVSNVKDFNDSSEKIVSRNKVTLKNGDNYPEYDSTAHDDYRYKDGGRFENDDESNKNKHDINVQSSYIGWKDASHKLSSNGGEINQQDMMKKQNYWNKPKTDIVQSYEQSDDDFVIRNYDDHRHYYENFVIKNGVNNIHYLGGGLIYNNLDDSSSKNWQNHKDFEINDGVITKITNPNVGFFNFDQEGSKFKSNYKKNVVQIKNNLKEDQTNLNNKQNTDSKYLEKSAFEISSDDWIPVHPSGEYMFEKEVNFKSKVNDIIFSDGGIIKGPKEKNNVYVNHTFEDHNSLKSRPISSALTSKPNDVDRNQGFSHRKNLNRNIYDDNWNNHGSKQNIQRSDSGFFQNYPLNTVNSVALNDDSNLYNITLTQNYVVSGEDGNSQKKEKIQPKRKQLANTDGDVVYGSFGKGKSIAVKPDILFDKNIDFSDQNNDDMMLFDHRKVTSNAVQNNFNGGQSTFIHVDSHASFSGDDYFDENENKYTKLPATDDKIYLRHKIVNTNGRHKKISKRSLDAQEYNLDNKISLLTMDKSDKSINVINEQCMSLTFDGNFVLLKNGLIPLVPRPRHIEHELAEWFGAVSKMSYSVLMEMLKFCLEMFEAKSKMLMSIIHHSGL